MAERAVENRSSLNKLRATDRDNSSRNNNNKLLVGIVTNPTICASQVVTIYNSTNYEYVVVTLFKQYVDNRLATSCVRPVVTMAQQVMNTWS